MDDKNLDAETVQRINDLAATLQTTGLAGSSTDAYEKAKNIVLGDLKDDAPKAEPTIPTNEEFQKDIEKKVKGLMSGGTEIPVEIPEDKENAIRDNVSKIVDNTQGFAASAGVTAEQIIKDSEELSSKNQEPQRSEEDILQKDAPLNEVIEDKEGYKEDSKKIDEDTEDEESENMTVKDTSSESESESFEQCSSDMHKPDDEESEDNEYKDMV